MNRLIFRENMQYYRTIFIGLGGIGTQCARWAMKWIKDKYDNRIPPFVKVLGIDTDAQRGSSPPKLDSNTQFVNISGFSANRLVQLADYPDINQVPMYLRAFRGRNLNPAQIHSGAHGVPITGRLCYAFRHKIVAAALKRVVFELLHPALPYYVKQKCGVDLETSGVIKIHIMSSVCGGTGAGILMDTAIDVRETLRRNMTIDPDICAHLVLPPVFGTTLDALKEQHQRNSYYILRQIDHLLKGDYEVITHYGDGETASLKKGEAIFDSIYVFNNSGLPKSEAEEYIGRMAVANSLEPVGMEINSTWDNLKASYIAKQKAYSGYSVITYTMPSLEKKKELLGSLLYKEYLAFLTDAGIVGKTSPDTEDKYLEELERCIEDISTEIKDKDEFEIDRTRTDTRAYVQDVKEVMEKSCKIREYKDIVWKHVCRKLEDDIDNRDMLQAFFSNVERMERQDDREREDLKKDLKEAERLLSVSEEGEEFFEVATRFEEIYEKMRNIEIREEIRRQTDYFAGENLKSNLLSLEEDSEKRIKEDSSQKKLVLDRPLWSLAFAGEKKPILDEDDWYKRHIRIMREWATKEDDEGDDDSSFKGQIKKFIREIVEEKNASLEENFVRDIVLSGSTKEIDKHIDREQLQAFLTAEVESEAKVQGCIFFQLPGFEKVRDLDSLVGYRVTLANKNCDCVAIKVKMAYPLDSIKQINATYKEEFIKAFVEKPETWSMPIFEMADSSCDIDAAIWCIDEKKLQEMKESIEKSEGESCNLPQIA